MYLNEVISKAIPHGTKTFFFERKVPSGSILNITHFSNAIEAAYYAYWGKFVWRIYVDGVLARGFEEVKDQLGLVYQKFALPFGRLTAKALIQVEGENIDTTTAADTALIQVGVDGNFYSVEVFEKIKKDLYGY